MRVRPPLVIVGVGLVAGALAGVLGAQAFADDPAAPAPGAAPSAQGRVASPAGTHSASPSGSPSGSPSAEPSATSDETPPGVRTTAQHLLPDLAAAVASAGTFTFTIELGDETPPFTGAARVVGTRSDVVAEMHEGPDHVEIRLIGDDMYASMGALTGGGWGHGPRGFPADPFSGVYSQLVEIADLAAVLADAQPGVVSVDPAGDPESVGGFPATPYDVVIDMSRATGSIRTSYEQNLSSSSEYDPMSTMRFWVSPDGLVRRLSDPDSGGGITYGDFGEPVEIEAPETFTEIEYTH